jgi:molecular chaperone HscC
LIIGIDLGTTNSVAARLTPKGPVLIPNGLGEALTPSVVGVDDKGQVLVGRAARDLQVLEPDRCAGAFKRKMGTDESFRLGSKSFTAPELSAIVLKSLKQDAEHALGERVERAVITVPAYFNERQRQATILAGTLAGLQVDRIINEPTAAALAYGFHEHEQEKLFLVFDLGGGTFDVSLVELFAGTVEVRATAGESFLGGEDFTRAMAGRLLTRAGLNLERVEATQPKRLARLVQQCESAKRRLSSQPSADVAMPNENGGLEGAASASITRVEFEEWVQALAGRCEKPLRRVLADSGVRREDVKEVLLVGGATRMPMIVELLERRFGKPPLQRIDPDHAVALGAAVQAGLIDDDAAVNDLVVTDVCPFTLGVEISKDLGRELRSGFFEPMINRNTTLPASYASSFVPLTEEQYEIVFRIYQGENRRVEGNEKLGELVVKLPRVPLDERGVEVRFTYDLNGVLEVEATVEKTKAKASVVLTRHAHGLSADAVKAAVAKMAAIKTHPREDLRNRALLLWAERLYAELAPHDRDELTRILDEFERRLSRQDRPAVEEYRETVERVLQRLDPDHLNEGSDGGE